jgi:hypothetical protein
VALPEQSLPLVWPAWASGLNFRVNPVSGTPLDGDAVNSGVQTDSTLNGSSPVADGTAYTKSFGGATITAQYTLDADSDTLYIQNPPNRGILTFPRPVTVGNITLNFSAVSAFDPGGRRERVYAPAHLR